MTVLAYQFGAGAINHVLPTDGGLMAVVAVAGVRFDRWFRFGAPACALLFVLGLLAITLAVSGSRKRSSGATSTSCPDVNAGQNAGCPAPNDESLTR